MKPNDISVKLNNDTEPEIGFVYQTEEMAESQIQEMCEFYRTFFDPCGITRFKIET